jgi:hypothetical protein
MGWSHLCDGVEAGFVDKRESQKHLPLIGYERMLQNLGRV